MGLEEASARSGRAVLHWHAADQALMIGNAGSTRDMSSGSLVITACRRSLAQSATWTSITSSWPLRAHSRPTARATFGVIGAANRTEAVTRARQLGLIS